MSDLLLHVHIYRAINKSTADANDILQSKVLSAILSYVSYWALKNNFQLLLSGKKEEKPNPQSQRREKYPQEEMGQQRPNQQTEGPSTYPHPEEQHTDPQREEQRFINPEVISTKHTSQCTFTLQNQTPTWKGLLRNLKLLRSQGNHGSNYRLL